MTVKNEDIQFVSYVQPSLPIITSVVSYKEMTVISRFSQRVDFMQNNAIMRQVYCPGFFIKKILASKDGIYAICVNFAGLLFIKEDQLYPQVLPLSQQPIDFFVSPELETIVIKYKDHITVVDEEMRILHRFNCLDGGVDCLIQNGVLQKILVHGKMLQLIDVETADTDEISSEGFAVFQQNVIHVAHKRLITTYDLDLDLIQETKVMTHVDTMCVTSQASFVAGGGVYHYFFDYSQRTLKQRGKFKIISSELAGAVESASDFQIFEKLTYSRVINKISFKPLTFLLQDDMAPVFYKNQIMLRSNKGIDFLSFTDNNFIIEKRYKTFNNEQFMSLVEKQQLITAYRQNTLITSFSALKNSYAISYAGDNCTKCYMNEQLVKTLPFALQITSNSENFVFAFPNGFCTFNDQFEPQNFIKYEISNQKVIMCCDSEEIYAIIGSKQAVKMNFGMKIIWEKHVSQVMKINFQAEKIVLTGFKSCVLVDREFTVLERKCQVQYVNGYYDGKQLLGINQYGIQGSKGVKGQREGVWYFDGCNIEGKLFMFYRNQIFFEWELIHDSNMGKGYRSLD